VTRALHCFGTARTVPPQPRAIDRSTLDHLDKTKAQKIIEPLIQKDFFDWHAACKEPRHPATGALP
jgi:hypothetical protein